MPLLLLGLTFSCSVGARVPLACLAACLTPRSLKGLAVSFGSDFLSRDVDRAVVALAVAVVLVPFGGAPDLVYPGRVARCAGFRRFSQKNCAVFGFLLSGFPYKPDTVLCLYRFSASFPYKLAKFPSS
jgi:hypothetical protein